MKTRRKKTLKQQEQSQTCLSSAEPSQSSAKQNKNTRRSSWFPHFIEHIFVVVLAVVLLGLAAILVFSLSFLNPISRAYSNMNFSDLYFQNLRHHEKPDTSDLVTIVDMTSLHERGDLAELLTQIDAMEPATVGVDVIFQGLKDDHTGNQLLIDAVGSLESKFIFGNKLLDYDPEQAVFTSQLQSFFCDSVKIKEGYTNLTDNMEKNVIRNYTTEQSLNSAKVPSFSYAIAKTFDNSLGKPADNSYINYGNHVFRIVPPDELDDYEDYINNHIVIVGALTEEADAHRSPVGKMSGVEIQAYTLETILQRKDIHNAPSWLSWFVAIALCLLFELFFQSIVNYVNKHNKNMFLVFLLKSSLLTTIILAIGLTVANWICYKMFKHANIYLDATLILSLMALVVIARFYYAGIIAAIRTKSKHPFVENSMFK